jgi:hypothetical protein
MFGQSRPEGAPSGIVGLLGIQSLLASRGVDHWVWFERLERKWSVGGYGDQKGHWRYRHLVVDAERANLQAEQYDDVTRDGSEGRVPPDLGGHQNRPGESRLH